MIGPMTYEAAGRVELGRDPEFPFFYRRPPTVSLWATW